MSKVFVLNGNRQPLDPVHPGRARLLLTRGKAAVFRYYPFTIIMREEVHSPQIAPLRLKIDPGSKTTGLAVVNDATGEVVWAAELTHRGQAIKARLDQRRAVRRSRRARKTRHRARRFLNRRRPEGWLPPSLESRVANVMTWVQRLRRLCPIAACAAGAEPTARSAKGKRQKVRCMVLSLQVGDPGPSEAGGSRPTTLPAAAAGLCTRHPSLADRASVHSAPPHHTPHESSALLL